jgi:hypothetical protein
MHLSGEFLGYKHTDPSPVLPVTGADLWVEQLMGVLGGVVGGVAEWVLLGFLNGDDVGVDYGWILNELGYNDIL